MPNPPELRGEFAQIVGAYEAGHALVVCPRYTAEAAIQLIDIAQKLVTCAHEQGGDGCADCLGRLEILLADPFGEPHFTEGRADV